MLKLNPKLKIFCLFCKKKKTKNHFSFEYTRVYAQFTLFNTCVALKVIMIKAKRQGCDFLDMLERKQQRIQLHRRFNRKAA